MRSLLLTLLAVAPGALFAQRPIEQVVPPVPTPRSFIADVPGVLADGVQRGLDSLITEVQRRTGGDVAVAIIPDLGGHEPVQVGVAVYRAWKVGRIDSIGSARRNLGALLLIVPKELAPDGRGHCWISTGIGAEGDLTDLRSAAICREQVIPHLRVRDYATAVARGVQGIGEAFEETVAGVPPPGPDPVMIEEQAPDRDGAPVWAFVAGIGLLGAGAAGVAARVLARRRPRPCPRGHGPMSRLDEATDDDALDAGQRTEERVGSIDYDVWACARCDSRLVIPYRRWSKYTKCPRCGHRTVSHLTAVVREATTERGGIEETASRCEHCGMRDLVRHRTPRLPDPDSSSSSSGGALSWSGGSGGGGGGGSSSSGSSFGGSGQTSGGGGGSSY